MWPVNDTNAIGNVVAVLSNCLMFSKIRQKRNRQLDAAGRKFVFTRIQSYFKKGADGPPEFRRLRVSTAPTTSVGTSL
ncbi:MAG: hypothetical protein CMB79_09190 [Filomicrobium sp.]|nr:hypothetical protein [Filomicrobium sp.]